MGKAKKQRGKAKRAAQRHKAAFSSPPEGSAKRYYTFFFIRASHASSNEGGSVLDRFDTIQIPDVIRKVPRYRAGTQITKKRAARKRTVFREAAKLRGVKTQIHNMILFTREEMVKMLMDATAEGEGFVEKDHLRNAAMLEMRYALSQGIITKNPTLEDTYLTLKCWFLFSASPEFAGCTYNRPKFWGDVVDIAVGGNAAVSVVDVFEDPESRGKAWEWAKGVLHELVDVEVPMADHFFLRPMFGCGDEGPDSEEVGSDSDKGTGADVVWPTRCVGGSSIQSLLTVHAHDSVEAKVACVVAKLSAVVTAGGDEPDENEGRMLQVISECFRSWGRDWVVEYEPVPADGLKYDADIVWKAFETVGKRSEMVAYAKKVKRSLQAPQEPDEGDSWRREIEDDDEPHLPTVPEPPGRGESWSASARDEDDDGRHSIKDCVIELVASCKKTMDRELPQELEDLQKFGFFTVKVFPLWYITLVEHLVKSVDGRIFVELFRRQSKNKPERWHDDRSMNTIMEGDLLRQLITSPLVAMMRGLGLLDVVGTEEKRVVDVCAALRSRPQDANTVVTTQGLQGMHADIDAWFKWMQRFGFSTITAGTRLAHLDIYAGSWDGGRGVAREPVRIDLPPGWTIVFNGLARHRGVSYPYESVRLFVSFVVKSVLEESRETDVAQTTALEKHRFQEPLALPLDEWKEFYMCRLT